MKLLYVGKDGGPESNCYGYWLVEIKSLFSIALLKFDGLSRETFHTHAFHSVSWLLRGVLDEEFVDRKVTMYFPSFFPILTKRTTLHRVSSIGTSWVLTFRGPWTKYWREWNPATDYLTTLTDGRKIVRGDE